MKTVNMSKKDKKCSLIPLANQINTSSPEFAAKLDQQADETAEIPAQGDKVFQVSALELVAIHWVSTLHNNQQNNN